MWPYFNKLKYVSEDFTIVTIVIIIIIIIIITLLLLLLLHSSSSYYYYYLFCHNEVARKEEDASVPELADLQLVQFHHTCTLPSFAISAL